MQGKKFKKTLWKRVKLLIFLQCFLCNLYLKILDSHIAVVVCSFFEFGAISKWCIREWVKNCLPLELSHGKQFSNKRKCWFPAFSRF